MKFRIFCTNNDFSNKYLQVLKKYEFKVTKQGEILEKIYEGIINLKDIADIEQLEAGIRQASKKFNGLIINGRNIEIYNDHRE